jgi:hypothetical protein
MKISMIAEEILKISSNYVSKKKFDNKKEFDEQIEKFINSIRSKLVKLEIKKSNFNDIVRNKFHNWSFQFEIIFDLQDPYINNKVYASGIVHIFPSKKLYNDINKICMNMFEAYPSWDETKNSATISGKVRTKK